MPIFRKKVKVDNWGVGMNKNIIYSRKLIECRELLGYTQSDMADIAGVSPETYKKHERGLFDFRLTEMLAIQENVNDELQNKFNTR